MRLSFGQEQRLVQQQRLIAAPRMIQSMEILQLPILALQERIEQELQENPTLELQEQDPDLPAEPAPEPDNPDAPTPEERELVVDDKSGNADDFERLLNLDAEWSDPSEDRPRMSSNRLADEEDRQHDAMANMESRPETLQDHLIEQLSYYELSPQLKLMAERIIYSLDHNGRLPCALADLLDSGAGPEQVALAEEALGIVQQLEPKGVGARDLRECLLLQITPDMPYHEEMRTLLADHHADLENNRLPAIQRRTGYSLERIEAALAQLRKLNPNPGSAYEHEHVPNVTPDIFLERDENGKYVIRLEEGKTPRLFISPTFRRMLMDPNTSPETREFIKKKVNAAQWLIEMIEQRRNTVRKVAQAIVDHQREFLEKGPEFIEPLKMQQIAEKVGVHVTTISRAVDDKWIQTPRGIFPLKRFFRGGTVSADGEEVAWDVVRIKLQEIIDKENKAEPLSDEDLVKKLAEHGLTVARRTVTKYRKAMKIPSSRQRRVWTAATPPRDLPDDDGQDEEPEEKPHEATATAGESHASNGAPSGSLPVASSAAEGIQKGHEEVSSHGEGGNGPPPVASDAPPTFL
jgi:RNA polymerase sigma-54 factor